MTTLHLEITIVNIFVLVAGTGSVPGGSVGLTVTDPTGVIAPQTGKVNGTETPTPYQMTFTAVAAAGSVLAQPLDATGAPVGSPITQAYGAVTTPGAGFTALTGVTVTAAP
jgi:hypothetical protein